MVEDEKALEEAVLVEVVRLNAVASGIVLGVVAGLVLFVATNWLVLKGGPVVGPHLGLLGQFLPGYSVTFWGSLVGFGYMFVIGFVIGYFVATLYNWLVHLRDGQPE